MNKVIVIGRLCNDVEVKEVNEKHVGTFSIAVQRPYKNEEGKYDADFFNVVVWEKVADNLAKFTKKGDQVAVTGRLQNRSYDTDNGFKRYVTEIVAENITYLNSKKEEE